MTIAEEVKNFLHLGGEEISKVFVLDGADPVGHRVVEKLIDTGYTDLRVGVTTLHEDMHSNSTEFVPFDWEKEDTYEAALKDVKTVFVTLPMTADFDKHFPHFLQHCTANHVKKIVKLSFYHSLKHVRTLISSRVKESQLVHKHALCDGDLILHKHLNATIIFATHLMSNVFMYDFNKQGLAKHHEIYGASNGKGVNYVSPNDVADAAVHAILDKVHKRQAYTFMGPTTRDAEIAKLLTDKFETTISYVEKPTSFFDNDTALLEKVKASGLEESFSHGDTKKILGREPETFADYLLATDRMCPIEQDVLAVHTRHHCHSGREGEKMAKEESEQSTEEEVGTGIVKKMLHDLATPASMGEVAQ